MTHSKVIKTLTYHLGPLKAGLQPATLEYLCLSRNSFSEHLLLCIKVNLLKEHPGDYHLCLTWYGFLFILRLSVQCVNKIIVKIKAPLLLWFLHSLGFGRASWDQHYTHWYNTGVSSTPEWPSSGQGSLACCKIRCTPEFKSGPSFG